MKILIFRIKYSLYFLEVIFLIIIKKGEKIKNEKIKISRFYFSHNFYYVLFLTLSNNTLFGQKLDKTKGAVLDN